jgi:excisionase family DNA binding protein
MKRRKVKGIYTGDERVIAAARAAHERLSAARSSTVKLKIRNATIQLPDDAVFALRTALSHLGRGRDVSVVPVDRELTTQQAADFLGFSRPFIIKQIGLRALSCRMVGRHRRLRMEDLIRFKEQLEWEIEEAASRLREGAR